jgi:peptidoglycan/xylan/chitin deacetylase (PgdA/CDA1 family)
MFKVYFARYSLCFFWICAGLIATLTSQASIPVQEVRVGPQPIRKMDSPAFSGNQLPEGHIAITIDDGPDPETTPIVLDVLRKHNVRATFFLVGYVAERYPDIVRRTYAEGHSIGTHTWRHVNLTQLGNEDAMEHVNEGIELVRHALGLSPEPLFRFPFLASRKDLRVRVAQAGLAQMGWNGISLSTDLRPKQAQSGPQLKSGIVITHDRGSQMPRSLDRFLGSMERHGYTAVVFRGP